ncbi:MAG: hypothetical protein ABIN74_15215, partial [Ferruginibacter sp.]
KSTVDCSNCLVLGSVNGTNGATSNVNVGIGTTSPDALLHVQRGAVLFDSTIGGTPVSGPGTRMMWIPAKGAFRAGTVSANQWDNANIGLYSVAMGSSPIASGYASTAMGITTIASGLYSVAMGSNTIASGYSSTAMGFNTIASGNYSTAMGYTTIASGTNSTAMGNTIIASGDYSTAAGLFIKSKSYAGFVSGIFNDSTNAANAIGISSLNRIFQVGNGTADNARSNAITILQNGNTGIGVLSPKHNLVVANEICVDDNDLNDGDTANALRFGAFYTGESIGSKRTAGGNHWGLDFITNYVNRMVITNLGNVGIGVYSPARKLSVATDIGVDENNTNNGTLSGALHFGAGNSGEAIASNRYSGNLWGLDFYTNSINRLSISNGGNVGIGTFAPTAKLDVNGTTTTNGLQVSDGTVFTKMQHGTIVVGSNGSGLKQWNFSFPVAFTSSTPHVFLTARNDAGCSSCTDAFSVSVRAISAVAVYINIQRTDTNSGWGQSLIIDWFAVE